VSDVRSIVDAGLAVGLNVGALCALPMLCVFQASARPSLTQKIVSLTVYSIWLCVSVQVSGFDASHTLTAYAYLLAVSTGVFFARRLHLLVHVVIFLIAPALLWPTNWLVTTLGWDVALSCFSYCAEVPRPQRDLRRYLFFVFVNPTVAYPARGERVSDAGLDAASALRCACGLLSLMLSGAIAATVTDSSTLTLVARLSSLVLSHAGLASLQIGLMRQLGYVVPERYRGLWSVRTPAQFWMRWNSYFATWAKLYVFTPSVRSLRALRLTRTLANALAVLATFAFMGALHDLFVYAQTGTLTAAMLAWFLANGTQVVGWHWAARSFRRTPNQTGRAVRALMFLSSVCALAASLP
jgi:hypothetical protein